MQLSDFETNAIYEDSWRRIKDRMEVLDAYPHGTIDIKWYHLDGKVSFDVLKPVDYTAWPHGTWIKTALQPGDEYVDTVSGEEVQLIQPTHMHSQWRWEVEYTPLSKHAGHRTDIREDALLKTYIVKLRGLPPPPAAKVFQTSNVVVKVNNIPIPSIREVSYGSVSPSAPATTHGNTNCPTCGTPGAYPGFMNPECMNPACRHYKPIKD